jgi:exodeoxyribonuclease X
MLMLSYAVLDTETTGLSSDDRTVSLASVLVEDNAITSSFYRLVDPQRSIPPDATKIHGITEEDVKDKPTLEEVLPALHSHVEGVQAYVAHNAPFDKRMLPGLHERPWIDTLVMARLLYPDLPSHRNETLRDDLHLDCSLLEGQAHNALYDAQVTARLFLHLLPLLLKKYPELITVEQLVTFLEEEGKKPRLLTTCFLPKHKGQKWESLPLSYLTWLDKNYQGNPSVLFTARHYLAERTEK